MLTRRSSRDRGKVVSPKCIMILSVVEVHVAKLSNMEVAEIVFVKLEPGDVACPIRRWHSASYNVIMILFSTTCLHMHAASFRTLHHTVCYGSRKPRPP